MMHSGIRGRRAWVLVVTLSLLLALRLFACLHGEASLVGDAPGYLNRAEEIVRTGRLPALTVQPNGYSILLAPFVQGQASRAPAAVVRVQQLLDFVIVFALA